MARPGRPLPGSDGFRGRYRVLTQRNPPRTGRVMILAGELASE